MTSWPKFMKNFEKRLDLNDLEEFQSHLNRAVDKRLKELDKEYNTVTIDNMEDPRDLEPYKDHLDDLMYSANSAKLLGYELSIIALYKKLEINTKKVVTRHLNVPSSKNLSYFSNLKSVVPFDITNVDGYKEFNELRLINNCIKHGGTVSKELAKECPAWTIGEELTNLDSTYYKILPKVKDYMSDFVDKIYESSNQGKPGSDPSFR